jgi:hypothetical protein
VAPFQVRKNKQLISVPSHNYQLRVFKSFRGLIDVPVGTTFDITPEGVQTLVMSEVGLGLLANAAANVNFIVSELKVYTSTSEPETLAVRVVQPDVVSSCLFVDQGSASGICSVQIVYPSAYRPRYRFQTASTSGPNLCDITVTADGLETTKIVVDIVGTFQATTASQPVLRYVIPEEVVPSEPETIISDSLKPILSKLNSFIIN